MLAGATASGPRAARGVACERKRQRSDRGRRWKERKRVKRATHSGQKSGPTAGKTEHCQLKARTKKTGCGKQIAKILIQEGSQPRYGEGRNEDQRSLRRVETRVRGAGG